MMDDGRWMRATERVQSCEECALLSINCYGTQVATGMLCE